jgi:hypothetical protein
MVLFSVNLFKKGMALFLLSYGSFFCSPVKEAMALFLLSYGFNFELLSAFNL